MINRCFTLAAVALLAGLFSMGGSGAAEFPSRLVRLIVPYPPGGGVDGLARPLADRLSRKWNQTVIVDNKAGASTIIGSEFVARSPPDGYTLLFTTDSSITSNPHLFRTSKFDPIKELAPVTQLIDLHQMVVAHPSVAANTLRDLVALAKAQPGKLSYGSYGNGSQPHLLFGMLNKVAGIDIVHVPYHGIAPALAATVGGEVQLTLGGAATTSGFFAAGKLKPLAIGRSERLKAFPDVPTLAEAGFPELYPRSWFGLFAPVGTPRDIIDKLRADIAEILEDPEFSAKFVEGQGYTGVGSTPDDFAAFIRRDLEYKGKLIAGAGVRIE